MTPLKSLAASLENMRDERKLEMWIWPLQPWQTSLVHSKAKSLIKDHDQIRSSLDEYIASHASNLDAKNSLRDDLKFFLNDLQMLYYCFDLATPEIISAQIESLSYYMKSVIEATMSKDVDAYDIISRICTTESIKLGRICCSKGILQYNVSVQKELNELAFTIIRAVKAMIVIGRTVVEDSSNTNAKKNMVTLATGLVKHFEKVCTLASNQEQNPNFIFSMDVVELCMSQYDTAVKELVDAILKYKASSSADHLIIGFIQQLSGEIKILQATFMSPYSKTLMVSIQRVTKCVEAICAHVYLRLTADSDAVLRDMLMNGMYAILHYCMQINLAACSKALHHPIIPPEITMLSSIRAMFVTLSIILINACPIVLDKIANVETEVKIIYEGPNSTHIERALIDIIHYGRELILRQNPIIVVQYSESKEVDDAFKMMEDELFSDIMDDPMDFHDIPHTKRPTSVMIPRLTAKKASSPYDSSSLRNKNMNGRESALLETIETNLHRNSLLVTRTTPNVDVVYTSKSSTNVNIPSSQSSPSMMPKRNHHKQESVQKEKVTEEKPVISGNSNNNQPTEPPSDRVQPWTDIPADSIDESNLPEGYPPAPPMPVLEKGCSNDEYKEYMIKKYEREQWDNRLILYKRKLAEQQQLVKK